MSCNYQLVQPISLRLKLMMFAEIQSWQWLRDSKLPWCSSVSLGVSFLFLLYIICQLLVQELHESQGSWMIYLSCIHTDKLCALPQWTFPLELPGKNEVGLSNGAIAHIRLWARSVCGRAKRRICAHTSREPNRSDASIWSIDPPARSASFAIYLLQM